MNVTRYHKFLRTAMLIVAVVLVFDSGIVSQSTKRMSTITISYLASVGAGAGVFASVPSNEYNTLSAQLTEQQKALDARETALKEREISARSFSDTATTDYSTYILSIIQFILIALIVFNYVLDFIRAREIKFAQQQVTT